MRHEGIPHEYLNQLRRGNSRAGVGDFTFPSRSAEIEMRDKDSLDETLARWMAVETTTTSYYSSNVKKCEREREAKHGQETLRQSIIFNQQAADATAAGKLMAAPKCRTLKFL